MDEISTRNLQYGILGEAVYRLASQSWSFSRTLEPSPRILYTGVTKTAVETPSTSIQQTLAPRPTILTQGYPELVAGYDFTSSASLSNTINAAGEACNPSASTLLDTGRAVDMNINNTGLRAVPIVAFAAGECGNIISFRTIVDDTVQIATAQLHVPTIGAEDAIEWVSDGTPVRQVCFSEAPEEEATFMAARFSSTAIFLPIFHKTPVSVSTHRHQNTLLFNNHTSRLEPNFLMEISTAHTGGVSHADVKFNPWDQTQLAIVDEDGTWGIWELRNQHRRNKDNWIATCTTSGKLPWVGADAGRETRAHGRHDGWLATEWVGTGNHIIVCDRRCSMLYRIEGSRTHSYPIELGFKRKSEWILDLKRSSRNPSHIFILTTFRLFWFELNLGMPTINESTTSVLSPRLFWTHFRDSDDTTLRLSSLIVDDELYLVLFSRLNHLVLAFRCCEPPELAGDPASAPDPFFLHIPSTSDSVEHTQALSTTTRFSTLVFKEIAPKTLGKDQLDADGALIKVFVVDSRLRVEELILSKHSARRTNSEGLNERSLMRVRNLRLAGQQQAAPPSLGEFIVDDWDGSALGYGLVSDRGVDSIAPSAARQFTLDFTQIYEIATGAPRYLPQEGEGDSSTSFQESFEELANIASQQNFNHSTGRTALEILRKVLLLDDLDQTAQDLGSFISDRTTSNIVLEGRNSFLLQPYDPFTSPSTQNKKQSKQPSLDLVAIYDRLINHWLVGLPSNIPGRARITKEKAIRQLVADIVLAQIILAHRLTTVESNTIYELPVSDPPGHTDEPSLYEVLPTFVDHCTKSQANIAWQSNSAIEEFILPRPGVDKCPTFRALSTYTTFSAPVIMSRDAERILDHWKPAIDPSSYSLSSEVSQLPSRIRKQRRKSRKWMSQKNVSLDSSVPLPPPPPVPAVRYWGNKLNDSQSPASRLQSSQVTDVLSMTQIERGTFGGREAGQKSGIKARKKKRAAGF
ncbi:RNA polymerase I-specific transcription initiation factor RRN6-like protein [Aspergillus karnatakaensis]|uniref:uncharacterized protein n=1 Tax=Aspergillus karnatakaensis TaxID=1810916 RepID=UPI003CCCCC76